MYHVEGALVNKATGSSQHALKCVVLHEHGQLWPLSWNLNGLCMLMTEAAH